jgi:predicted nucleotide-binding protein
MTEYALAMDAAQESLSPLKPSAQMIRDIGAQLEAWSTVENAEILAEYEKRGFGVPSFGDYKYFEEALEQVKSGAPSPIFVNLETYSKGGRFFTVGAKIAPFGQTVGNYNIEDFATWLEQTEPETFGVTISVYFPRTVHVKLEGSTGYAWLTAEVTGATGFNFVDGYASQVDPALFLDPLKAAMEPYIDASAFAVSNNVFLGHGHGDDWRIVRDKLDAAGFDVVAFESTAGAGDNNIDVVDLAMRSCFAAVIFATPDDTMEDGTKRPRQNVIHEIGLAQGILSRKGVVIVQNEECVMPSNLDGVNVTRYKSGALYGKLDEIVDYVAKIKARPQYVGN